jgi:hypothetical protein
MAQSKVVYTPRADATPESERSALVAAYRLILDCHTRKKGARPGRPDDSKEIKHVRAETIIPK